MLRRFAIKALSLGEGLGEVKRKTNQASLNTSAYSAFFFFITALAKGHKGKFFSNDLTGQNRLLHSPAGNQHFCLLTNHPLQYD